MNQVFLTKRQQSLQLGPELGGGGEGRVCDVIDKPDLVAKIYKTAHDSQEREAKLQMMVANPPDDPMKDHGHISIAWPIDLLYDQDKFIGYLMPRIQQTSPVFALYHPKERAKLFPGFNTRYLLAVAKNIAIALEALHKHNYVFGDFNESNILVAHNALVTFIDTDSYQVTDHQGNVYPCPVGKPEFTPPELQGQDLKTITRSPTHDQFGLAVMIFYLLMEGFHPFQGKLTDSSLSISQVDLYCIKHGIFPYQANSHVSPSPNSPPFEMLHPNLQRLFIRCFVDGYNAPSARPSPQDWQGALEQAEKHLKQCKRNREHYYSDHLKECPWCKRETAQIIKSVGVQIPLPPPTPTPSSPPPTPQTHVTPPITPTSSPKSTKQLLSFAEWRDSIKRPFFIGAISGLPMAVVILLMFELHNMTSGVIGIITAIAIITVTIYMAVKISSRGGRLILIGAGLVGGVYAGFFVSAEVFKFLQLHSLSIGWLFLISIYSCAIMGIAFGNFRLLRRLNYSIVGIFLSVGWLVLPISIMWSIGFFSKLVEPKTPVVVISTPKANTTPTLQIIETPVSQIANTLESTQEPIPTSTFPIVPTKTRMPEVTTPTISKIDEICVISYTVISGDTLGGIAKRFLGNLQAYGLIINATNKAHEIDSGFTVLSDPLKLAPGNKLCIPKTSGASSGPILPSTPSAALPLPAPPPTSAPAEPINCSDPRSIITSPADGAIIRDVTPFMGTASLDNLKYYKFEYRPTGESEWRFLTKFDGISVNNNKLMDWHTYTVNPGTYDIRLTVVDVTENYLQPCEIQVTITR